jgi:DNA-binding GntR family transcriptional regulator
VSASRDEVRRLIGRLPSQGLAAAPTTEGAMIVDLSKAADLEAAFALVRSARDLSPAIPGDPRDPLEAALVALARALDDGDGAGVVEEQERHDRRAAR